MDGNFDDYDFTPSVNSNLASLFGMSPVDKSNTSLTYTAPKQPRPTTLETSSTSNYTETSKPTSSTVAAQVVSVWKLVSNKYESMGKLGLALIESPAQNVQEIILYKDKHNVISRAKIFNAFTLTQSPDNFASFYDHEKQCWLIKFNTETDLLKICTEIENRGGKIVKNIQRLEAGNEKNMTNKAEDGNNSSENEVKIEKNKRKKPDIITRISKMGGQSILPNSQHVRSYQSTDISDSEDDSFRTNSPHFKSSPKTDEIITAKQPELQTTTNIVQIPPHQIQNTFPGSFMMGQYDPMSAFLSENRNQNTEMRINLSQISEKLNQVLRVVENSNNKSPGVEKNPQEDEVFLKSRNKVLELRIDNLTHEIHDNQQKFNKLQQEYAENSKSFQNIGNQNQKLLEQSFQENEQVYKSKIKQLEETGRILNETMERQRGELEECRMKLQQCEEDKNILQKKTEELEASIQELSHSKSISASENSEISKEQFIEYLKETMNTMYGNVMDNFAEDEQYSHTQINSIVAKNIKVATRKIIQRFQDAFPKAEDE